MTPERQRERRERLLRSGRRWVGIRRAAVEAGKVEPMNGRERRWLEAVR